MWYFCMNIVIDYSITKADLSQGTSFDAKLRISLNFRYRPNNPSDLPWVEIFNVKGIIHVKSVENAWFEVVDAEQEGRTSVNLRESTNITLLCRISRNTLDKIEQLRDGRDLWFKVENLTGFVMGRSDNSNIMEYITPQLSGHQELKYPRSEWIDHLNNTEHNKIELIELPKILLPKMPITEDIMKFLTQSTRAMNEGRYSDVLKECRNAFDALDNGVEEWGKNMPLTDDETSKIKQNNKSGIKREIYLSRLIDDKEKASRISKIIGDLHYYFSLNPHEAEYKGIQFTIDDAKFVIHSTTSLINNILKYIANKST